MALLIDTDVLVGWERGEGSVDRVVGEESWAISVITVSELLHGVHRARGARRSRRRAFVEGLLAEVEAVPVTMPVARVHAEVWAALAERGEVIGLHDLWIGATALGYGLGVATRNPSEFQRIPGLRVVAAELSGT